MIDIGINLGNEAFDHDRDQVLINAQAKGVKFLIMTGSCSKSNEFSLAFASKHPHYIRATVGIHPHHADTVTHATLSMLQDQLKHPMACAVGETGLDFFRDISNRQKQEWSLEAHLELAAKSGLPVFLHQRESHERFLPIIKQYRESLSKAVVHCFTDEKKALFDYLDLDLHIGITGWVADERRGLHLLPLLKSIPQNRFMIETDGPYLLPRNIQPKPKNRRNEPQYLPYIAQKIAETLNMPCTEVEQFTTATARDFFDLNI